MSADDSVTAGVHAIQLFDVVEDYRGEISYEEAQTLLGFDDEEMRQAFLILREGMRRQRRRSAELSPRDVQRQQLRAQLESALALV